jgi:hypothetical protein
LSDDSFVVTLHEKERVLEVVYPARITLAAFEKYETQTRELIAQLAPAGPWHCLVDQSRVAATMSPDMPPRIADLVAWSLEQGMDRVARVLSPSELGRLQTGRILRAAGVSETALLFQDRESAWAFVTTGSKLDSSLGA